MRLITSNTKHLKQLNAELIKHVLIKSGSGTIKVIAEKTGLSVATCANIINDLLESGEVIESDILQSDVGRPSRQFAYNANFANVACIYLNFIDGVYSVNYTIANMLAEILEESVINVEYIDYQTIDNIVGSLIEKNGLVETVGIGVPGVTSNNIIIDNCDIPSLLNSPLSKNLREKYSINVIIENNMNLIAYGLYKKQNYINNKNIAVISFPKGHCIGSGIIINGQVIKGDTNFAGEISYLPFNDSQDNQLGVLETDDDIFPIALKSILSIITIINPSIVALEGSLINKDLVSRLRKECSKIIPEKHLPRFIHIGNVHELYMNGLISATLESFFSNIRLVARKTLAT